MTAQRAADERNDQPTKEESQETLTSSGKEFEGASNTETKLLEAMVDELNRMENASLTQAWIMAQQRCPHLVNDDHKLLFLRVEDYDVELACLRLLRYWSMRLDLFGEDKAFERITLEKTLKEDRVAIEMGGMIFTGKYDSEGRGIYYEDDCNHVANPLAKNKFVMRISMVRTFWYTLECALEDEKIRQNGLVAVSNAHHWIPWDYDAEQVRLMCNVMKCVPVRFEAFHICRSSWMVRLLMALAVRPKHFGILISAPAYHHTTKSPKKLLRRLERHGIPRSSVPVELGGTAALNYGKWLEQRRDLEAKSW